jgi:cathepsin B
MMNRFLLSLFFLLIIGSQAQQLTSEEYSQLKELLAKFRHSHESPAPSDTKTDIEQFSKGFLEGLESDPVFDDLKSCLSDDESIMKDLQSGISLIRTKDPESVKQGIKLIGQAAEMIPAAAKICGVANERIQKLIEMIKSFTDPKSFMYHVGKSLLVNHVEVIHQVQSAIKAYEDHNMNRLGFWVGSAMATIFIGDKGTFDEGLIPHINEVADWEATSYEMFEGLTIEEFKNRYLGATPIDLNNLDEDLSVMNYEGSSEAIPAAFDSREEWPGCVHPIRNQEKCGSCWAFAASEVLSDRFCIASNKKIDVVLSPQYLVSCDTAEFGCGGGYPGMSWKFLMSSGVLTDGCLPYKAGNGTDPVKCKTVKSCEDGSKFKNYYAKKGSATAFPNAKSIQNSILKYGPVEATLQVFEDFKAYKSGIYKHVSGKLLGGHAVKLVGWGEEKGTKYWICANSWTENWGEQGFFRIAFGQVGIDSGCIAGEADLKRAQMSELSLWL